MRIARAIAAAVVAGVGLWRWFKRPGVRQALDRRLLSAPQVGGLIKFRDQQHWVKTEHAINRKTLTVPQTSGLTRKAA